MKRRDFLKAAAVLTAVSSVPGLHAEAAPDTQDAPGVRSYRNIGKTGLKMSDSPLAAESFPRHPWS